MSIKTIETASKVLISVVYRMLLLSVGIAICIIEQNILPSYLYIIGPIAYTISWMIFRVVKPKNSLPRLLIDYGFIIFILYGKPIDTFINACFIIIPIVNSVNHTSDVRNYVGLFRLYLVCLISMFIISKFQIKVSWILMFLVFGVISGLTKLREWLTRLDNAALVAVTEYHAENLKLGGSHLLLRKMITNWRSNRLLVLLCGRPVNIVAFKKSGDNYKLITGSNFVKNYSIIEDNSFLKKLNENKIAYNANVIIDETKVMPNVCLQINGSFDTYMFYIGFSTPINERSLFGSYMISVIYNGLHFIAKVLDSEGMVIMDRNNLMRKMKYRLSFMEKTVSVVHFINNRLSPIVNYFQLKDFYNNGFNKEENPEYIDELKSLMDSDENRAKDNLKQIDIRAKAILGKSVEIRNSYPQSSTKYKQVVKIIRDVWNEHNLLNEHFLVEWNEETLARRIITEFDGFWLAIEEIVNNMSKHGKISANVRFKVEEDGMASIQFENELDTSHNIVHNKRYKIIIDQFNNNDMNEIMKRNSHGLYMVKSFFNKINVISYASVSNDRFLLTLKFPVQS